ncbi:hypothetical protein HPG69_005018, partial [Diceros bicornis minor]
MEKRKITPRGKKEVGQGAQGNGERGEGGSVEREERKIKEEKREERAIIIREEKESGDWGKFEKEQVSAKENSPHYSNIMFTCTMLGGKRITNPHQETLKNTIGVTTKTLLVNYLPDLFQAEVEETLKRIQSHKGVIGTMVVNAEGIPIRTTLDNSTTVQYAGLLHQLTMKARSTVRDIDPQNDLTFLRIRSKKHEIMVAP